MGRVNVNQLDKVEELPSKLSIHKSLLKNAGGSGKIGNLWDIGDYKKGPAILGISSKIMRSSVGVNWDEVANKIREKVPEDLLQKYPYLTDRPDVMIQNSVTGYWHWQDSNGRLSSQGYKTPKNLKNSSRWGKYYLDVQGRLKWVKGRSKIKKEYVTDGEKRRKRKNSELCSYLASMADIKISVSSYFLDERYPKVTFKHPTKKQERMRWDSELKQNVGTGIYDPIQVSLNIPQFIEWCKIHNKTYFFYWKDKAYTNLKWSFKQ